MKNLFLFFALAFGIVSMNSCSKNHKELVIPHTPLSSGQMLLLGTNDSTNYDAEVVYNWDSTTYLDFPDSIVTPTTNGYNSTIFKYTIDSISVTQSGITYTYPYHFITDSTFSYDGAENGTFFMPIVDINKLKLLEFESNTHKKDNFLHKI